MIFHFLICDYFFYTDALKSFGVHNENSFQKCAFGTLYRAVLRHFQGIFEKLDKGIIQKTETGSLY